MPPQAGECVKDPPHTGRAPCLSPFFRSFRPMTHANAGDGRGRTGPTLPRPLGRTAPRRPQDTPARRSARPPMRHTRTSVTDLPPKTGLASFLYRQVVFIIEKREEISIPEQAIMTNRHDL